jgi:ParB/RepB/Spo0J family partition protein
MSQAMLPDEHRTVPLHRCLPPHNDREDRDEALMKRLTDSITKEDFLQPVRCVVEMVGSQEWYRVVTGWTRVLCGRRAGKTEAPAIVIRRPLTETDDLLQKLSENDLRGATSLRDRIRWYYRLLELNPEWTHGTLAKAVHASPAEVSKTLAISKRLPPELLEKVGTGPGDICPRAAYALCKLEDPARIMELADRVMKGLLNVEAVEMEVAKSAKKPRPKDKAVKVSVAGVSMVFSVHDLQKAFAAFALVDGALKKLEKHQLPLSSLPALLRG